jgi:hypothetical protein
MDSRPIDEVFAFFSDARNLEKITLAMAWIPNSYARRNPDRRRQ